MKRVAELLPAFLVPFVVGVFLAARLAPPPWFAPFLGVASVAFLAFLAMRRTMLSAYLVFAALGLIFGMMRYDLWANSEHDPRVERSVGTFVSLEGTIATEPDAREGRTSYIVSVDRVLPDAVLSSPERVILQANRFPEYRYGDRIRIEGKLARPEAFKNDDGRTFDYPSYLATKGVYYRMSYANTERVGEGEGNRLIALLLRIKRSFQHSLESAIPEPENGLLEGVLLGEKQALGKEWVDRFREAGIVHVVVLSGYNMTVVAEWLLASFRFLGFAASLAIGAIGVVLFAIMTGGGATVVRAALMSILALVARATGRTYDMGRALLIAGASMILMDPGILPFDPSFQLSFLASLGLVYLSPYFDERTTRLARFPAFREVLVATLSTQILVLPLLLFSTGTLSLVSLPANLLVLPVIPIAMFFGFVAGVAGYLHPFLAIAVGLPAYGVLGYVLGVAKYASLFPYASVSVSTFGPFALALSYLAIALFLFRYHRSRRVLARRTG